MTDAALKIRVLDDVKQAMKDKSKELLSALRMLTAAIKQREVDERIVLNDQQIVAIVDKLIKQRRESVSQYIAGNRPDLADKERYEIEVLQNYLPQQLSEKELSTVISLAVEKSNAVSIKDMGKVMTLIKDEVQGRADMGEVSKKIKEILAAKG